MAERKIQTPAGQETATETAARARALLARSNNSGGGTPAPQRSPEKANPVLEALTERLIKQGEGISSSSSSNLQATIADAIRGTEEAGRLTNLRLQSEREREIGFAQDRASATFTQAAEERTGFATQVAALRELTETTEKSIRDLDKRYQEAMLSNDAETARTIAGLKVQKLQFAVEQEQNFYTNLFSLAGLNMREEEMRREDERFFAGQQFQERMFERQVFQDERNILIGLAGQYGVPITDNESVESMISKISPFVDEKRGLELEAMRMDIEASRARIAESRANAAAAGREGNDLDSATVQALALAFVNGDTGFLEGLRGNQAGQVYAAANQLRSNSDTALKSIAESSASAEDFRRRVMTDESVIATEDQVKAFEAMYSTDWDKRAREQRTQQKRETQNQNIQRWQNLLNPFRGNLITS